MGNDTTFNLQLQKFNNILNKNLNTEICRQEESEMRNKIFFEFKR